MKFNLPFGFILASSCFVLPAAANSGYAGSCNSEGLDTPADGILSFYNLHGNCQKLDTSFNVDTNIDLDTCIVNIGGVMHPLAK
jgi:hypothetical protein